MPEESVFFRELNRCTSAALLYGILEIADLSEAVLACHRRSPCVFATAEIFRREYEPAGQMITVRFPRGFRHPRFITVVDAAGKLFRTTGNHRIGQLGNSCPTRCIGVPA